ncbi:hypothetical protein [Sinomonas atrocyanea]|uniref:hypothetical protein n=1 Tax=Sinomonas atrocyanea TaxID=37927 RepID=UPI002864722D|nr:hypothetical protein [Sinomonas atrocyanea]MDR6622985.1 cytoskeletal protein RodZ [Sinomonas atrocyanea]
MLAVVLALVCLGVATVPALVLVAAAVVLGTAVLWKSRARRSAGSAVVPAGAVWGAGGASLLSLAVLSFQLIVSVWPVPHPTATSPRQDSGVPTVPSGAVPAMRASSTTSSASSSAIGAPPSAAASDQAAGAVPAASPVQPAAPAPEEAPAQPVPVPAQPVPAPSSASTQPAAPARSAPARSAPAGQAPPAAAPSPTSGGSQTGPSPVPTTCTPDQTSSRPTVQIGILGVGATVSGTGGGSCN